MALEVVVRNSRRRRRALAALALWTALAAGCTAEQDPGFVRHDGPAQTSDTLGRCPAGGPDATTPPAGCLGRDGEVRRP